MLPNFKKPPAAVSERMRRVKSRGTSIEKEMVRILKSLAFSFEEQPDLIGHPDFRIRNSRLIVFCDSSFWHGRRAKERSGKAFHENRDFWVAKLEKNRKRDLRVTRTLRNQGWSVARFWDTDILNRPDKVRTKIKRMIERAKKK